MMKLGLDEILNAIAWQDELLNELDNYAFIDITEEAKSKLDKNKVQLSAFMNATYKKKSRGN